MANKRNAVEPKYRLEQVAAGYDTFVAVCPKREKSEAMREAAVNRVAFKHALREQGLVAYSTLIVSAEKRVAEIESRSQEFLHTEEVAMLRGCIESFYNTKAN